MKLAVDTNEVVLSNVGATGEFRIRNSAKAFKILSDGLYSNKIRAIIRELSCNAVDSHVAAGKADVPFEVHLPTMLEPWFSVRDFGTGLDNDQVVNIYTTYFESTKTDSNAYIGALGLGSKSPFSYTENFTVTAVKNGYKRIYSAFINENGVPSIAQMNEELTDEGNGVEVKFSVTERYDYQSFANEARYVFKWFKLHPTITGVRDFSPAKVEYEEKDIVPGVSTIKSDGYSHYRRESFAVMGNIAYPLNKIPEPEKHFGNLAGLLECGLIMVFDIGELDFAASREELSFVPLTIQSIKKKLEALNANLAVHLAKEADGIESEWERAHFLRAKSTERIWQSAVPKYVADTKFELYDPKSYHGTKKFYFSTKEYEGKGVTFQAFRVTHGSYSRIGFTSVHSNTASNGYEEALEIEVEPDVVIVLNDLKTGCLARARYHFTKAPECRGKRYFVYCINSDKEDVAARDPIYKKFIKDLHNPPVVMKASELIKVERVKTVTSNQGIMELRINGDSRAGYEESYSWYPITEPLDPKKKYYYVCLSNYQEIDKEGNPIGKFKAIKGNIDRSGIASLAGVTIYGVRRNRYDEIKGLKNWLWIEDLIKEETAKISDADVRKMVVQTIFDTYSARVYTNKDVVKLLPNTSPFVEFNELFASKQVGGDVQSLIYLCSRYGKKLEAEKVRAKLDEEVAEINNRYPLLKHMKHTQVTPAELAHYVNAVDKLKEDENE